MDNSPFGRLPAELRNKIYEYALLEDGGIAYLRTPPTSVKMERAIAKSSPPKKRKSLHNGLPSTCREIRQECRAVYFALNSFEAEVLGRKIGLNAVAKALGADMVQHIRHFTLSYPRLHLLVWWDGVVSQEDGCASFFRTRQMVMKLLGSNSCMICEMLIRSVTKYVGGNYQQVVRAEVSNADLAMHSIRDALRPAREFLGQRKENQKFVACLVSIERALQRGRN